MIKIHLTGVKKTDETRPRNGARPSGGDMEKREILDLVRNKLTLPRVLLQRMITPSPEAKLALEDIDELLKEIESYENPHNRSL